MKTGVNILISLHELGMMSSLERLLVAAGRTYWNCDRSDRKLEKSAHPETSAAQCLFCWSVIRRKFRTSSRCRAHPLVSTDLAAP
jgi:hypothetical protein